MKCSYCRETIKRGQESDRLSGKRVYHRTCPHGPPPKEAEIQNACAMILEYDGWRRLRTDPVSRREWAKGFGEPGMADDLFIRYGYFEDLNLTYRHVLAEVMWIEWKRKGGSAAEHQIAWHVLERKRGALTLIAGQDFEASVEGFKAWYQLSGLQRRSVVK